MKGRKSNSKDAGPSHGISLTRPSLCREPLNRTTIFYLFLTLTGALSGAFEGADLFRTAATGVDGIFPPAMNSPARLPDQPLWLSLGRGRPLGLSWATYSCASIGGQIKTWRGAASVWSSGDSLYREICLTAALARQVRHRLTAGLSMAYHRVTIAGFKPPESELLMGVALTVPLTENLDASIWYSGVSLSRKEAYESLTRQLFQLAVASRIGENTTWTLAVEKTPGYDLRQLLEVNLVSRRDVSLQLGYRTAPGLPYAGARVPIKRLVLSVRLNYHPIFGLSTAFGFAIK